MTIHSQALAPSQAAAASKLPALPVDPKLKKECVTFEGQFFDMMLQEMRKTIPPDPELGDDAHQQEIFQGMMDDQVSQQMAQHGGANDIAEQMYKQLVQREMPAATTEAEAVGAASPNAVSPKAVVSPLRKSAR